MSCETKIARILGTVSLAGSNEGERYSSSSSERDAMAGENSPKLAVKMCFRLGL